LDFDNVVGVKLRWCRLNIAWSKKKLSEFVRRVREKELLNLSSPITYICVKEIKDALRRRFGRDDVDFWYRVDMPSLMSKFLTFDVKRDVTFREFHVKHNDLVTYDFEVKFKTLIPIPIFLQYLIFKPTSIIRFYVYGKGVGSLSDDELRKFGYRLQLATDWVGVITSKFSSLIAMHTVNKLKRKGFWWYGKLCTCNFYTEYLVGTRVFREAIKTKVYICKPCLKQGKVCVCVGVASCIVEMFRHAKTYKTTRELLK